MSSPPDENAPDQTLDEDAGHSTRNLRTPSGTLDAEPVERNTQPNLRTDVPTDKVDKVWRAPKAEIGPTAEVPAAIRAVLPPRFELIGKLGVGGMGRVYAAQDKTLGRMVAIKQLRAEHRENQEAVDRFFREAQLLAQLDDPGIVKVYELLETEGCLVMELVEGENLLKKLKREGTFSVAEVKRIAAEAARVLEVVHDAGLVHRDVKPENFILTPQGRLKLVDFGVAWAQDARLTKQGYTIGTPGYMSPEQLRGQAVDARTDFYALGATLYELATGEMLNPAEGPRRTLIDRLRMVKDPELRTWIARCVDPEPERRFSDSRAFLQAVQTPPIARPPKSRRALVLAALALAGLGVGAFTFQRLKHPAGLSIYVEPASAEPASDPMLEAARKALNRSNAWVAEPNANQADRRLELSLSANGPGTTVTAELAALDGKAIRSEQVTVQHLPVETAAAALACQLAAESGAACSWYRPLPGNEHPGVRKAVDFLRAGHVQEAKVEMMAAINAAAPHDDGSYYQAIASWWSDDPTEQVSSFIAQARKLNSGPRVYFLDALKAIHASEYDAAAKTCLEGLAKFPDDLDLLYGLMEAWYHGGHPDQALEAHLLLRRALPDLQLALVHAFDLAILRRDPEIYDFLATAPDVTAQPDLGQWVFRRSLVRRDYDAMFKWFDSAHFEPARLPTVESREINDVLTAALATGHLEIAHRAAALTDAARAGPASIPLQLALAEGDAEAVASMRSAIIESYKVYPGDRAIFASGVDDSVLQLAEFSPDELSARAAWLDGLNIPDRARSPGAQWTQVLFSGRLGRKAPLEASKAGTLPAVQAAARGYLARLNHADAEAAEWFGQALALLNDSRYFFVLSWERAQSLLDAGEDRDAIAACEAVLKPWTGHVTAAGYVAPCLSVTVRAQAHGGLPEEARATLAQLEALRPKAPDTDPWVGPARGALK